MMKSIPELRVGDIINMNGEIYQLIGHSELAGSEKGERVLELGRLGERIPSPIFRLIYPIDNPTLLRLYALDRKTGEWNEQRLTKFGY